MEGDGRDGARQALNLDHELRLMGLEGRMTAIEQELADLTPVVNEVQLANRVAAGVKRALDEDATGGLNRWQKIGIAAGVLSGVGAFLLTLVQAVGHA